MSDHFDPTNIVSTDDVKQSVLHRLVSEWSYKPGCRLKIVDQGVLYTSGLTLRYEAYVGNVLTPEHEMIYVMMDHIVSGRELYSYADDERYWKHVIFELIRKMELHEMDEWLKFDGANMHNPETLHAR